MGYWSDKAIEVAEYGDDWLEIEKKSVCQNCLNEEGLADFIKNHSMVGVCSYCEKRNIVASMREVIPHIQASLSLEWGSPDLELPYDPEDDVWIFEGPTDTSELLEEYIFNEDYDPAPISLVDDINSTMALNQWAKIDAIRTSQTERLTNSWQAFCYIVKHERRFFFNVDIDHKIMIKKYGDEVELAPQELLSIVLNFLKEHDRLTVKKKGWKVKRCQHKERGSVAFDAARMGPPPIQFATQPNRMSPSGVSMFYGSPDREVCLREIASEAGHFACGTFVVDSEICLVDLTGEIHIPSLFDEKANRDRPFWQFISYFLKDFRQPIEKDGREHIDYVPTQVVSEFFRSSNLEGIGQISGIIYESTQVPGKNAVVLFADSSCVLDEDNDPDSFKLTMIDYEELDFVP